MDQSTMRIEIRKNQYGGWGCTTFVKHPEFPNEAVTNVGYSTLKSALWHLMIWCTDKDCKLLSVTVKGKDIPFGKVWEIVCKALTGGALAYNLPRIKELLEVKMDQKTKMFAAQVLGTIAHEAGKDCVPALDPELTKLYNPGAINIHIIQAWIKGWTLANLCGGIK